MSRDIAPDALLQVISRFRRRSQLVLFARSATVAYAAGVSAMAVSQYVRPSAQDSMARWWFVAAAIALAAAGIVSFVRRPAAKDVATALDRRLRLEDRVTAALQVQGDSSAVATLVVRDAMAQLESVSPARVFPLRLQRVAAFALVATTAMWIAARTSGPAATGTRTPGASGGAISTASEAGRPEPGTPADDARQAVTASPSTASPEVPDRQVRDPDVNVSTGDRPSRQARSESDTATNPAGVARDQDGAGSANTSLAPAASLPRSSSRAAGNQRADAALRGTAAGEGIGGKEGTGASGTGISGTAVGAGGVSGGALTRTGSNSQTRDRSSRANAAGYDASRQIEAALARDEVPPRHRAHVRDYFLAIQSPRSR